MSEAGAMKIGLVAAVILYGSLAMLIYGCGSGGGEDSESSNSSTYASASRECYFDESGVNLGEVGSDEGEEAAEESFEGKYNLIIQSCGDVTIDQSQDNDVTTTTTETESNINSGNTEE